MSSLDNKTQANRIKTVAHLLDAIRVDLSLDATTRKKWCSAIRGLARGARALPNLLPATGTKFVKAMNTAKASHHHASVSKRTWQQYWTGWRAAARHYGLIEGQARNTASRSVGWNALLHQLPIGPQRSLIRFASEMSLRGIEPADVRAEHFDVFRQALDAAGLSDPAKSFKSMSQAWHYAQAAGIGWPDAPAPAPAAKRSFWRSWSEFPPSLEADVDAFLNVRTSPKTLDVKTLFQKPTGKTIRTTTAEGQKCNLRALASAAVATGIPPERLTSLQSLVDLKIVEPAMQYMVDRRICRQRDAGAAEDDDQLMRGSYLYNIAHQVLTILRRHFKIPEGDLEGLAGCVERLAPRYQGMAASTKEQLDVLRQPRIFFALFHLPERLFAELEAVEHRTVDHGWTAALALALAIDLDTAFRRSNMTGLRLDRHFGPIDRATGRAIVEIPLGEGKTDTVYTAELRPRTVKLLDNYLRDWRPVIFDGDTPFLFPDETGGVIEARRFASRLSRLVERRLGVRFTMHRVRSLLASLYAEANPDDERTAQLKLGHADRRTTEKFYIDVQQRRAIRRFDAVIESILEPPSLRVPRRTDNGGRHG